MTSRRTFLKTGVALLATQATPRRVSSAASLKDEADAVLRRATDAGDVPGVVVTATSRDRMIYQGAFGQRDLGANVPMTTDSVVWIASMTKAITGAAAMQLVERGKLDLDSPANRWVPEL